MPAEGWELEFGGELLEAYREVASLEEQLAQARRDIEDWRLSFDDLFAEKEVLEDRRRIVVPADEETANLLAARAVDAAARRDVWRCATEELVGVVRDQERAVEGLRMALGAIRGSAGGIRTRMIADLALATYAPDYYGRTGTDASATADTAVRHTVEARSTSDGLLGPNELRAPRPKSRRP